MEPFGIKDVLYIAGIIVTVTATFFTTKHKLKEYVRDKTDDIKEQISQLKIELNNLKSKDDLQQQVIEQIGKQIDILIPKLLDAVKSKEYDRSKR
jgi:hypothetical protein